MDSAGPAAIAAPGDSSRLEAFSDGTFAFAATLLVVALEVPSTMQELERVLLGFVPFTLSFGALIFIWSVHRAFFRRFPLGDRTTVALNSCLLFVVLFYVYPLKFLARGLAGMFFGRGVGGEAGVASLAELGSLFTWYGAGFAAIFLFFALLYLHAARLTAALDPAGGERAQALFWARHYAILCSVGLLSLGMAIAGVGVRLAMPGWIYALIGPLCGAHGYWNARRSGRG
jgi:uncharacterized membrane protein